MTTVYRHTTVQLHALLRIWEPGSKRKNVWFWRASSGWFRASMEKPRVSQRPSRATTPTCTLNAYCSRGIENSTAAQNWSPQWGHLECRRMCKWSTVQRPSLQQFPPCRRATLQRVCAAGKKWLPKSRRYMCIRAACERCRCLQDLRAQPRDPRSQLVASFTAAGNANSWPESYLHPRHGVGICNRPNACTEMFDGKATTGSRAVASRQRLLSLSPARDDRTHKSSSIPKMPKFAVARVQRRNCRNHS